MLSWVWHGNQRELCGPSTAQGCLEKCQRRRVNGATGKGLHWLPKSCLRWLLWPDHGKPFQNMAEHEQQLEIHYLIFIRKTARKEEEKGSKFCNRCPVIAIVLKNSMEYASGVTIILYVCMYVCLVLLCLFPKKSYVIQSIYSYTFSQKQDTLDHLNILHPWGQIMHVLNLVKKHISISNRY